MQQHAAGCAGSGHSFTGANACTHGTGTDERQFSCHAKS